MVFSETTIEFCSEIMARSGGLPAKVLDYPRHWWVDHILESDMAYKKFVEGKG
jgi:hemerythrin